MKKAKLILASVVSAAMLASCGNAETKTEEKDTEVKEIHTDAKHSGTYKMDLEKSTVMWKGTMMGMYSHEGTVPFTSAWIEAKDGEFVDGEFVVDLTQINPTDDGYSEDKPKEKLVGHLSSPDFFDVANFPTATFEVTGSNDSLIMGNLTIRGNTHEETATVVEHDMEGHAIVATLTFDRTKYDVAFKHPMQEMVLSNDIELGIHLFAIVPEATAAAHEDHADHDQD